MLASLDNRLADLRSCITTTLIDEIALNVSVISVRPSSGTVCGSSRTHPSVHPAPPKCRLQCPVDCPCRCHSPFSRQLIAKRVMPYIGALVVSRRILHSLFTTAWECNVQTCRRDRRTALRLSWFTPSWLGAVDIDIRVGRMPIYIAIHAPRLVPFEAEVWRRVLDSDADGLRALFEAGEASVYDVDPRGASLLPVSLSFGHSLLSH